MIWTLILWIGGAILAFDVAVAVYLWLRRRGSRGEKNEVKPDR